MPSQEIAKQKAIAFDQPNLSPNQVERLNAYFTHIENLENSWVLETVEKTYADLNASLTEQEQRASAFVAEKLQVVKAAKERKVGSKELIDLRNELSKGITYLAGDGQKRRGLLQTIEDLAAQTDAIEKDPGAYADVLYRKYPMIAERRFNPSRLAELNYATKQKHPLS